jgi:hypothetical protein
MQETNQEERQKQAYGGIENCDEKRFACEAITASGADKGSEARSLTKRADKQ